MPVLSDLSLGKKLQISILGSSVISVLMVSMLVLAFTYSNERNEIRDELMTLAKITGDNSAAALLFLDEYSAEEILSTLRSQFSIEAACLYTPGEPLPVLFASYLKASEECPDNPVFVADSLGGLAVYHEIRQNDEIVGSIFLKQNYDGLNRIFLLQAVALAAAVFVAIITALGLALKLRDILSSPILHLTDTANRIGETGNYGIRARAEGNDEISQLVNHFNMMLEQIEQQNRELIDSRNHLETRVKERTSEIEMTLDQLKNAQEQLIQTEKLAALGGLVAGVAHEINTPVGVGMTAGSSLYDDTMEMKAKLEKNTLTREDLLEYMDSAIEASDIVMLNLKRAADLVKSFKQVAIDQSSLERRTINLREYLDNLLVSLQPALKRTALDIRIECDDKLSWDTYPGAVSQILTNLLMNSVIHGYEEGEAGRINIRATLTDNILNLVYEDDGKGVAPENQGKIFEPFYTTRREHGGSGLGMHIVHNLVTQTLGGSIKLKSAPGEGVQFTMDMPVPSPVWEETEESGDWQVNMDSAT